MSAKTKILASLIVGSILNLGLVVPSVGAAPSAFATPAALSVFGDAGPTVVRLQEALIARGFTLKGGADGVFSATTQATLKNFQKVVGFKPTGRLDERTAKFLGLIAADQPKAKKVKAAATPAVAPVVAPVAAPVVSPVAAPTKTAAAPVAATTAPTNTPIDGMLTIDSLPARGQKSDAVRLVQEKLIANSIEVKGGADGIFGVATTVSLTNFQKARGLNATGAVDLPTAVALGVLPDLATLGIPQISVFPSQGRCSFVDSWHEPRSGGRLHIGVDIIGPKGLALYAVVDGTITKMYGADSKLSGNALRLTAPDSTYYFYAHLDSFAPGITIGSTVRAGQIIGYMGATGNAGNSHLHFEIHRGGGEAINPYPVIKAVDACHVT
ncbi:MAG: peptidoglycan-binding protein, partial [Actinomycetota bacterium]